MFDQRLSQIKIKYAIFWEEFYANIYENKQIFTPTATKQVIIDQLRYFFLFKPKVFTLICITIKN